jgi:hypothetical protein
VLVRDVASPCIVGSYYSVAHGRVGVIVVLIVAVAVAVVVIVIVIVRSIQLAVAAMELPMRERRLIGIRRGAWY